MFSFFSFHDCACHRVRCSSVDGKKNCKQIIKNEEGTGNGHGNQNNGVRTRGMNDQF